MEGRAPLKNVKISLMDAAILLYLVHQAANDPKIGYEDVELPLAMLTRTLNSNTIKLKVPMIESMLWSANLMAERGRFKTPQGETFEEFVARLLDDAGYEGKLDFDKKYNWIVHRGP